MEKKNLVFRLSAPLLAALLFFSFCNLNALAEGGASTVVLAVSDKEETAGEAAVVEAAPAEGEAASAVLSSDEGSADAETAPAEGGAAVIEAAPAEGEGDSAGTPASGNGADIGPDGYPKVIDRITYPGICPDFSFSPDDDLLEVWFPSVRDQDAAIFFYQDQVWMLDCGDERAAEESVPLLRYLGVDHIDKLLNTHPHHDHLNGLYSIDAFFPIRELCICFPDDATKHMTAAMEYCKGNGITISHFADETVFSMGDGLVSFLAWMKTAEEESMNDRSAQFMISYGRCNLLSMADMELHGQQQLYDAVSAPLLDADILRYPHHGKRFMYEPLFQAISPALVIISNASRIPDIAESTKFLDYKHIPTAYTRRQNYVIHLVTDGEHWLCEEVDFDPTPYLTVEEGAADPASDSGASAGLLVTRTE